MTFYMDKVGNAIEEIDTFSFRNRGSISIPKKRRERSLSIAIDVIVQSVNYPQYKNGKSEPSISFYGYALLVFQDCLSLEIPIHQPRQRIYYERQEDATSRWFLQAAKWENYLHHRRNEILLASIMGALEIPYTEYEPPFKKFSFIELPLREVYVTCTSHTQFKIESSFYLTEAYETPINGHMEDGVSGQSDGDKDSGLPKDGIQPSENPSGEPWQGNQSESVPSFESGFSNINNQLSNADPNNDTALAQSRCSITIRTFSTSPESPVGVESPPLSYENVIIPLGDSFVVERWDDSSSFTGSSYGVKLLISGKWYLGGNSFSDTRSRWSQRVTTTEASCVRI